MGSVNVWGLGDEASSTSVDISGQLRSKLDRNRDEMRGNLKMNGFAITGLPANINLIEDDSDAASCSVCNELLNNGLMNRVCKDGDDITGDLFLQIGGNTLTTFGCADLTNHTGFSLLLGTFANQIQYERQDQAPQPIKIVSSNGTLFQLNGEDYLRIGANANRCIIAYKPLKLMEPIEGSDAATKQYVDNNILKQVGLIPLLSSPSSNKSGHIVTVSSQFSSKYSGHWCFGPINDWATANVLSNFWIKIQCPFPIFISKLQVRGRTNGNNPTLWRLEGSNNDSVSDVLLSSNQEIVGTAISKYNVNQKPPVLYKYYRIFCIKGNGTNPGLSYI